MLARFQTYIPLNIHLTQSLIDQPPSEFDLGDMRIRFYPPYKCSVTAQDTQPGFTRFVKAAQLDPISPQPFNEQIIVNDEQTLYCDAIQIDFIRKEFQRSPEIVSDPPIDLIFSIINDWLARLRVLARAGSIKPLTPMSCWRIMYLNNDGSPLELDPTLVRVRGSAHGQVDSLIPMTVDLWRAVDELRWGYDPVVADSLLVDAEFSASEIGPAIVLAFTAVETRISYAISRLAQLYGVNPTLWTWLNERDDLAKRPSVTEEFDALLVAITQRSLKQEPGLWQAFQELRRARNSFVHGGQAIIGKAPVTLGQTVKLICQAREILDWIDSLLPAAERRPNFDQAKTVTTITSPAIDTELLYSQPTDSGGSTSA